MQRYRIGRVVASAVGVLALVTAAGCSSGGTASSSADPAASAASEPFRQSVTQLIDALKQNPTATPPTDGPTAAPGKKIAIVAITETDAGALQVLRGMQEATEAIGWQQTTYNANGNQADANRFMQQAATTQPDAIVVLGLNNTQTGSGLAAAAARQIPVACVACWDESQPDGLGAYAVVEPPRSTFSKLGYADAAYAFEATGGSPAFLTFNDTSLSNLSARQEGFDRFIGECTAAGGACSVVAGHKFQVSETTTGLAGQAAAVAQANPRFNVVWTSFDNAGVYVMTGLRQAGKATSSGFLISANGDPANLDVIEKGGYQKATVAMGGAWLGWGVLDNLNRHLAGQPNVVQNVPLRLFDSSNIAEAAGWDGGIDFRAQYKKVWGR